VHPQAAEYPDTELAIAMEALGRHADLERLVNRMGATKWRDLVALIAAGRHGEAADLSDELGEIPAGALLRFHAAERLATEGRAEEARAQLARALDFWRSVAATRHIEEAGRLSAHLEAAAPKPERAAPR
jgi:anti-sigma-K factor RskA